MSSTASATLSTWFKIKGVSYSISSACSTSSHCIGNAAELIQFGKQDVMFAGGCEELDWTLSVLFDAMGAMSSHFNDTPAEASRAYDKDRDGFVIAGGAGVVVLEELSHAKARGARIYGEVVGYGATSDGYDMVQPSGEGAERCMRIALANVHDKVDYINPHATSTPAGDGPEIAAIRNVFGGADKSPPISATKSLTGHSLGAAGVQEVIYSLLMMNNGFICEVGQHRGDRSRVRRHADRAQAHGRRRGQHGAFQFVRLRRRQRIAGLAKVQRLRPATGGGDLDDDRGDEWQARPGDGGRERSFDRLGDRPAPRRARRRARLHLPDRGARQAGGAAGEVDRFRFRARLRRRACSRRRRSRRARCRRSPRSPDRWPTIDFIVHAIAFSDRSELKGRYADTTRDNFLRTLLISCFSFTEVAQRAARLMPNGGAMVTLTYGGSNRVMPNYNVMGVAKAALEASVRYLAVDFGAANIRVNAISAGPVRTLAGSGVSDARLMFGYQKRNAPLRRTVAIEEIGNTAVYLLSDLASAVTGEIHYVDAGYNVLAMPRLAELKATDTGENGNDEPSKQAAE